MHNLKFQIKDLRQQNIQDALQAISVILASLVVASLLPTLLITYVYTDQAALMTETPFWIQNGPLVVFAVGIAYFLYMVVANVLRGRKIAQLRQQLLMTYDTSHLSDTELAAQQAELNKLEKMVDSALDKSSNRTRRVARKTTRRRSK